MSPEYAMQGQFSVKSDVFSFGVLLLEIISGQKNSNFYQTARAEDLVGYVRIRSVMSNYMHFIYSSTGLLVAMVPEGFTPYGLTILDSYHAGVEALEGKQGTRTDR